MAVKSGEATERTGTEYVPFTREQAQYLNAGGYKPWVPNNGIPHDPSNPFDLMFRIAGANKSIRDGQGRINPEGNTYGERYPDRQYIYMDDQAYEVDSNPYYKGVASLPQAQSSFQAYGTQGPSQYDAMSRLTQQQNTPRGMGYAYNRQGYSRGVDQINQYDPLNPTG